VGKSKEIMEKEWKNVGNYGKKYGGTYGTLWAEMENVWGKLSFSGQ
jgi:hypothetical protein